VAIIPQAGSVLTQIVVNRRHTSVGTIPVKTENVNVLQSFVILSEARNPRQRILLIVLLRAASSNETTDGGSLEQWYRETGESVEM